MTLEIDSEHSAIAAGQRAYARRAAVDLKNHDIRWPIIPDRRWSAEQDEQGRWIVSAYYNTDEPPIASWRAQGGRLVRLI